MRPIVTIVLEMLVLQAVLPPLPAFAQFPPTPRQLRDDGDAFSAADFQRALSQLKTERDALDADWKSLTKRLNTRTPSAEPDLEKLQEQLKKTLARLQQDRIAFNTISVAPPVQPPQVKPEHPSTEPKKKPGEESPASPDANAAPGTGAVDVVHLAQTLLRAERYEEALKVFRSVDLKGKKPEERAPVIYLTAECLHHLGKTDDAIALLREVANSKGDERVAGYAQWQIENMRWHRDTQARLLEIRRRLQEMEKR
jgi:TolA-binding protein